MQRKHKELVRDVRRDWQLYLFLLIPLVYIVIFAYIPMVGIQIAFKDYSGRLGMWGSPWVGLNQFRKFFASYQFKTVIVNTLALSAYSILFAFPIPVIFALLINCLQMNRFKKVALSIVSLPHFISTVVLVGILLQLFNARTGLYGNIMMSLFNSYPADPFANAANFRHFYIWSGIWQDFGWSSIIYVAALSASSPTQHEAAQIDGASRWQRLIHLDIPCILPTVIIMLILRTGSIMTVGFEKAYLMQNSLNLSHSEVISTYVYKVGLASGGNTDFSYSTAIGLFNSIINLVMISTMNFIAGKLGDNSLW